MSDPERPVEVDEFPDGIEGGEPISQPCSEGHIVSPGSGDVPQRPDFVDHSEDHSIGDYIRENRELDGSDRTTLARRGMVALALTGAGIATLVVVAKKYRRS